MKNSAAARLALCLCFWAFYVHPETVAASLPALVLTNIAQLRALSASEAARGHLVRLRATVTFEISPQYFFIHDLREGLCIERTNATFHLRPGEIVELEGTTRDPEGYAPIVKAEHVRVIGNGQMPVARQVPFDELVSSGEDCQWLEVQGVVRTAAKTSGNCYDLELAVAGRRLRVYMPTLPAGCESRIVDSAVIARGVRGCIFNQKRQVLAPLLFVHPENLVIKELAPEDPFALPARSLQTLLQFLPNPRHGHRIKVCGVVTHQQLGRSVFMADGMQGLRLQSLQATVLNPGDIIEVLGFEAAGKLSPLLEDVIYRRTGNGPPPIPSRTTVAEALQGKHDADLVSIEGTLVGSVMRGTEEVLIMEDGGAAFDAHFSHNVAHVRSSGPLEGSRLRLTGICQVQDVVQEGASLRPETFRILMRSPADIVVLRSPPWWTPARLIWLFSGVTLLFFTALGTVLIRSRLKFLAQNRDRLEAETRFSAIMAERNRMAREIHDTLAQGYTAISAQLEILKDKVSAMPEAAKHLQLARTFVRSGLAEARRSIWEMRSQALEQADLPQALTSVAEQLTAGTSVRFQVRTAGTVRRLPVVVENNLLRIGQEALTNALKYAQAKEILIALDYEAKAARLRVRDDGLGFDSSKMNGTKNGGFGLVDMCERVQQLSGRFVVNSAPGHGTEVLVEVPVA